MNIEVGDKVTYDNGYVEIICDDDDINYQTAVNGRKIVKIERPEWRVVEEKKELLTEEEKTIIKSVKQSVKNIKFVMKMLNCINFYETKNSGWTVSIADKENFKKLKEDKFYTLSELRIGGINGRI